MNTKNGKWALITGALSGFGMDFARALAATGHPSCRWLINYA
jgi:short-subunit dehydrogenase